MSETDSEVLKSRKVGAFTYRPILGILEKPNGETVELTLQEDIILDTLTRFANITVPRFTLMKELHDKDPNYNPTKPTITLKKSIANLRLKLGSEKRRIQPIRGEDSLVFLSYIPKPSS